MADIRRSGADGVQMGASDSGLTHTPSYPAMSHPRCGSPRTVFRYTRPMPSRPSPYGDGRGQGGCICWTWEGTCCPALYWNGTVGGHVVTTSGWATHSSSQCGADPKRRASCSMGTSRNLPCSPEPGLRLHKSSAGEQLMSAARRCPHRRGTPRRVFPPHAGCADAPALLTSHTSRRAL